MRIGLFGGSFDPVHNGHLALAEACRVAAGLDDVWFVPTAVQPHKRHGPVASNEHRVEMLRLAKANASLVEIERGGVSYTVDTLRELCRAHPEETWFLLMGADTLHDLPNWREPAAILRMASPLVVHRPGEPAPDLSVLAPLLDDAKAESRGVVIEMPAVDISSSDLRQRVAAGVAIGNLCPPRVVEYIQKQKLYRD